MSTKPFTSLGLSTRAAICLIRAGFETTQSVKKWVKDGAKVQDLLIIESCGLVTAAEIAKAFKIPDPQKLLSKAKPQDEVDKRMDAYFEEMEAYIYEMEDQLDDLIVRVSQLEENAEDPGKVHLYRPTDQDKFLDRLGWGKK